MYSKKWLTNLALILVCQAALVTSVFAHGITTFPRQLWVWNNSDSSADGYLFWFITNGRNEMPPWGLILSENDRWDVINYIKTLTKQE